MDVKVKYRPHDGQFRFHDSTAKFRAVMTGVGFGKTAALVNEVLFWALTKPSLYAIAAPTFPLLVSTTMREFFKFCPPELVVKFTSSPVKLVKLANGSEIIFISGDDDRDVERARGLTLGGFALDEVTLFPYLMWQIMIARLRDAKGEMRGICMGTPRGDNWTKQLFVDLKSPMNGALLPKPEDYAWFGGSTLDNPYTPQEYKDTLLNEYTGAFREQEIYGKFVAKHGLVYPNFSRNVHVIDTNGMKFKEYKCGVDFGFTNPSVILKIGYDYDGRAYVTQEFYQSKTTDAQLAELAKQSFEESHACGCAKHSSWRPDAPCESCGHTKKDHESGTCKVLMRTPMTYIADSANPGGIEEFKKQGLNCTGASKMSGEHDMSFVMAGIKAVSALFEVQPDGKPRLYIDKRCVQTIMELENYSYPEKKEGMNVDERPIKLYDHSMDALRYAVVSGRKTFAFGFG